MRQANADDLADLLELMQEFYAESGFALNPDRARAAFPAVGFDGTDRELLTLALAAPTHAA